MALLNEVKLEKKEVLEGRLGIAMVQITLQPMSQSITHINLLPGLYTKKEHHLLFNTLL